MKRIFIALFGLIALPALAQISNTSQIPEHDGIFSLRFSANVSRALTAGQSTLPDGYSYLTQPFYNGLGASFNYGQFISIKDQHKGFWETGVSIWTDQVAILDANEKAFHFQQYKLGIPLAGYIKIPFRNLESSQHIDVLFGLGGMLHMDLKNFYGEAFQDLQAVSTGFLSMENTAMNVDLLFDTRFMIYGQGKNTHIFGIKTMFSVANLYFNAANTLAPLNGSPAIHTTTLYYNLYNILL